MIHLALGIIATLSSTTAVAGPVIDTQDVTRFYELYDATGGRPTADQQQHAHQRRAAQNEGPLGLAHEELEAILKAGEVRRLHHNRRRLIFDRLEDFGLE